MLLFHSSISIAAISLKTPVLGYIWNRNCHSLSLHLPRELLPDISQLSRTYLISSLLVERMLKHFQPKKVTSMWHTQWPIEGHGLVRQLQVCAEYRCDQGLPPVACRCGWGQKPLQRVVFRGSPEEHWLNSGPHLGTPISNMFSGIFIIARTLFLCFLERTDEGNWCSKHLARNFTTDMIFSRVKQ